MRGVIIFCTWLWRRRSPFSSPAWLANDFNASRRHALIVAQVPEMFGLIRPALTAIETETVRLIPLVSLFQYAVQNYLSLSGIKPGLELKRIRREVRARLTR